MDMSLNFSNVSENSFKN